ncbi:4-hydroxy-tetrahydrodipicolinate synthase [Nocardia spumae]|uniref:4-hydroxy-tetrahydrodipicolinate synthase n=1 Tax=Nocardia spumae TaxID=2887190 RepID=UPI001D134FBB|nr:4-hydroxy-tetrahydrodipicolinate synthase [Nocardia spumae]
MNFSGLFVPLITPFTEDGRPAYDVLAKLANEVLDAGATGIVALGTTAEPATLTVAERREVVTVCTQVCLERGAPLIVGTGTNATADSERELVALDPRIAGALTVVPYYTRPSEAGVIEHFRRLAAASPVPLIIYNVPQRTGRPLAARTLCQLADIPNVAGFKHAVGAVDEATIGLLAAVADRTAVLCGDDLYAAPQLALGARGAILTCANVAPNAYAELVAAWREGRIDVARRYGNALVDVARALFAEPNPVVVKGVLAARGRIPSAAVRLPLLPAGDESTAAALAALDVMYDAVRTAHR